MANLNNTAIKMIVMRRVWYSFLVGLFLNRAMGLGIIFGVSVMLLKELVFVERVIENLMNSGLIGLPGHLFKILLGADWPSLALFLILVSLSIYFLRIVLALIKPKLFLRPAVY